MHPVIRIVTFLVGAAFLALGSARVMLVLGLIVLLVYIRSSVREFRPLIGMLRRMRWLFLSLLIVYFWFTPGRALIPVLSAWSPTAEGVGEGLLRVGALMLLVAAVHVLLQTTSRAQLLTGIHWMAAPVGWLGLSRERLAVRMVLTLEAVPEVQQLLAGRSSAQSPARNAFRRIGAVAADLMQSTLRAARKAPRHTIELPDSAPPSLTQWLYPCALGMLLFLVR